MLKVYSYFILFLTSCFPLLTNCQILAPIEAESIGLGGTAVLNQNPWASIYNPAGMMFMEKTTVGISYFSPMAIPEMRSQSIAGSMPVKNFAFGLNYHESGYELFNENRLGLALAMKLGEHLYAGIEFTRYGIKQGEDYGRGQLYNSGIGIITEITNRINLGFSIQNIGSKSFDQYKINRPGIIQKLGVQFKSSDESVLIIELEKSSISKPNLIFGIQYKPHPYFLFRTGISSGNKSISFGIAYLLKILEISVSNKYDRILGYQPCLSITFNP